MKLTARGAMKTRQDAVRLTGFSKMWKSGDKATVFYPLALDGDNNIDILVAACFGHNVDVKELGLKRVFIPTTSKIMENGQPEKADVLYLFSKLAPLFIEGAKEKELAELAKKKIPDSLRNDSLTKIKEKYEKMDPVVGKLRDVICTNCLFVPMDANDVPLLDKARIVEQDLSDERINALLAIIDNAQFAVNIEDGYVEVTYAFGTSGEKKEDGKVLPVGVTPQYSLKAKHPDLWPKIAQYLAKLPTDDSTIYNRNSNFIKMSEAKVLSGLTTYAVMHSTELDNLSTDEELERLVRNSKIIEMTQLPLDADKLPAQKLEEYKAEQAKKEAEQGDAPTVQDLISKEDIDHAREGAGEEEDLASKGEDAGLSGNLSSLLN